MSPSLDRHEIANPDRPGVTRAQIEARGFDLSQVRMDTWLKIGGVFGMGFLSGMMNVFHGPAAVLTAGAKQSAYSAASASLLFWLQNRLGERNITTMLGELSPMFLPALLTILANYGVHSMRGTAEPLLSTLPTAILATGAFPLFHISNRVHELWKDIESLEFDFSES